MLELAAGTGLLGLNLALCSASEVLLTDKESMQALLRTNIAQNKALVDRSGCKIRAAPLDWFCTQLDPLVTSFRFDVIVLSDVFYEVISDFPPFPHNHRSSPSPQSCSPFLPSGNTTPRSALGPQLQHPAP